MSRGVNKVILVGHCGKDPERRSLPSGMPVVDISLATTSSWTDKSGGGRQEKTEWHRVVFFPPLADIVSQYVKKGSQLYIEGSLRYRESEKDGVRRYFTDIVAREMNLLGSRSDSSGYQNSGNSGYQSPGNNANTSNANANNAKTPEPSTPPPSENFDDDLPF